jgi:surface antigen
LGGGKRPDIFANSTDTNGADSTAYMWTARAQTEGLVVNGTPAIRDIAVWSQAGNNSTGHAVHVEAVNPDGTITVSELNHHTSNQGDTGIVPACMVAELAAIYLPTGQPPPPPPPAALHPRQSAARGRTLERNRHLHGRARLTMPSPARRTVTIPRSTSR